MLSKDGRCSKCNRKIACHVYHDGWRPCKKCKHFKPYLKKISTHIGECQLFIPSDPDASYVDKNSAPPCAILSSFEYKDEKISKAGGWGNVK